MIQPTPSPIICFKVSQSSGSQPWWHTRITYRAFKIPKNIALEFWGMEPKVHQVITMSAKSENQWYREKNKLRGLVSLGPNAVSLSYQQSLLFCKMEVTIHISYYYILIVTLK